MSLKEEWEALLGLAERALDDITHLDATTVKVRDGKRDVVVRLRMNMDGDIKAAVDREATPELLEIQLRGAKAMVAFREARLRLAARIIGAAL